MTELLPCPFCGGDADLHHDAMVRVECLGCTASAYAFDQEAAIAAWNRRAPVWQPIATAPKDGTRFWGKIDDDAIAMLWHEGFGAFVSSWRRMEMAPGYLIDGKEYEDHSPVTHHPTHWQPLPAPPQEPTNE